MHGIHFGSPGDLPDFMQKLAEDRHFAMDFWALNGALSSREGGQLSDEQMLSIIVEGVAGREIRDSDGDLKKLVGDLTSLLAGVDIQRPPEQSDAGKIPISSPPKRAPFTDVTRDESGGAFAAPPEVPHPLGEALSRLEQNNRELKQYLTNIDRRMSRIEPHLEELTSKVSSVSSTTSSTTEPVHEHEQRPLHEHREEEPILRSLERTQENPTRLVLEPAPPPRGGSFAREEDDDDPSIPIPLEGYAQGRSHRSVVVFAVLALLVVGGIVVQQRYGASLWERYGPSLRERYSSVLQQMRGGSAGKVEVRSTDQNTVDGSAPAAAIADTNHGDKAATPPVAPSASTPQPPSSQPPKIESSSTPEQTAAPVEPQAVDGRSRQRSRRQMMLNDAAAAEAADDASQNASSASGEAPINVAPAVMEANLISSRVPVYPEAAKAERIEGPVIVQAIISKDGMVNRVYAIQGDRLLREAASDAVRKRRYKPYLLNGRPVEVATTVTVDFKLNR
ncbi:MAG: Ferric siderophore transport system, periplasmic binding protein TonB [Edaphobacter sp.]|nr:Ferric siderophore transport system, periplasmic binding protein TonB [Edaphobacter sp.]